MHPNAHICVFARNEAGRREITAALSYAQEFTFWRVPRIGLNNLLALTPENVFITTACVAYWGKVDREVGSVIWHPNHIENFKKLRSHFGNSIMLEVQAHDSIWQREVNTLVIELSQSTDTKIIAGLDSHYIFPEQKAERRILREESGVTFGDEDYELDSGVYEDYPDEGTLIERFKLQGILDNSQIADAIKNTNIFLSFEDIVLDKGKKLPSIYHELSQEMRNEKYRQLLRDAWLKYRKTIDAADEKKYLEAISYEADTITTTGFSDYFIINHAIIARGREMGAKVTLTSRGSGSSFFTNTLLGFSTIDRITLPIELYPERFVSRERLLAGQLPDIDINTSDQDILEAAQKEVLGEEHAFPMVAYGTLRYKSAFRMYARSMGLPVDIQNAVSKQIEAYETELKYTDEDEKDTVDIADFVDAQYMSYIEESAAYRGIVVTKSKAPCSYLLYDGDIRSEVGLMRIISAGKSREFTLCTVVDGSTADDFGFVKNDLLQVDTVRLSALAFKEAGLEQPTSKELIEITAGDKPTWEIYAKGATLGINQCEKQQAAMKLQLYKPQNIAELSAFVAAIRPGFKSMVGKFLTRNKFEYGIPSIDRLLQGKYMSSSWLLYQEQVMKILSYAGFPMDSTYGIVKAISKKRADKIMKIKPTFFDGFKKRVMEEDGATEETAAKSAEATWNIIEDSSAYSFNACVSGDTKIYRPNGMKIQPTIEEMYKILHGEMYSIYSHYFLKGYGPALSMDIEHRLIKNTIVDIRYSGVRNIYRMTLKNGMFIDCTSNHKFPTVNWDKCLYELNIGDPIFVRKRKKVKQVKIISIEFLREDVTYDVEMANPYHNFVANDGIVTCNSHSAAVALDGLYCAYIKGNNPLAFYKALLTIYQDKKNKDKISEAKDEMLKQFGIKTVPCKFRQDNKGFLVNTTDMTVSDALSSMKGVSNSVAYEMYAARNKQFDSFVDLLLWMHTQTTINISVQETLIRTDYFMEFGDRRKLIQIYNEFYNGETKFSKGHIDKTKESRLSALREKEIAIMCLELGKAGIIEVTEQLKFETSVWGSPLSTYLEHDAMYTVVDINDKPRTPIISFYSTQTGIIGRMRIKRGDLTKNPIEKGDTVVIKSFERRSGGRFVNGAFQSDGTKEVWVKEYAKISEGVPV